jgi:hypothetical protein
MNIVLGKMKNPSSSKIWASSVRKCVENFITGTRRRHSHGAVCRQTEILYVICVLVLRYKIYKGAEDRSILSFRLILFGSRQILFEVGTLGLLTKVKFYFTLSDRSFSRAKTYIFSFCFVELIFAACSDKCISMDFTYAT